MKIYFPHSSKFTEARMIIRTSCFVGCNEHGFMAIDNRYKEKIRDFLDKRDITYRIISKYGYEDGVTTYEAIDAFFITVHEEDNVGMMDYFTMLTIDGIDV